MKKIFIATAVALSLSAAAQAAESTAVLKVTGVLTNDACTPALDGGGVVDFGTKYINELSATETNQLGHKDVNLTINCTTPTKVSWRITDDRIDSVVRLTITGGAWSGDETAWAYSQVFGVGKTAGGVNIGAYAVDINRTASTADGNVATVLYSPVPATTWSELREDTTYASTGEEYTLGTADTPVAFTTAVFPLRVALAVDKTDTLAITDNTDIDGQATITLRYL
ncbi:TPA: DUF1120 domain-containing protein [Salmonella enterica subsp. salamae serovar 1,4,12,[27]:b:[e,n,x]]|uniref:DUF1120 domain-containing protein n=1 Tax=Salmonella enterica TaxID=28901 RepID=UPI0009AA365B|nr:DUF1120 domain-containing protein [Salmonella enterica]EDV4531457.1 DUF1120 domain-containing protein [Salmonella enterica subsp. enterica]QVP45139.1 DUF1120 domain-containing protein [Salmonella enterica subsp. salamae]